MKQITNFIEQITLERVIDVLIAILIILVFRVVGTKIASIIAKDRNKQKLNTKKLKRNSIYVIISSCITLLGIYVAILFLKESLQINENVMEIINKGIQIVFIILLANGIALNFNQDSILIKKLNKKRKQDSNKTKINFICKIIKAVIYIVASLAIITILGFDLSGLIAGIGVGGVILTLAAQDTAKNLFGGFVILMDSSFDVGDMISVDTYEGTVEDITFRNTKIRTFENSVVTIPNSIISNANVTNLSSFKKRRYKLDLVLELGTPLEKVKMAKERILKSLQEMPALISDTAHVTFDKITEDGINLFIYVYTIETEYNEYLSVKESINYELMQILEELKIELAYKTQTIYVKK